MKWGVLLVALYFIQPGIFLVKAQITEQEIPERHIDFAGRQVAIQIEANQQHRITGDWSTDEYARGEISERTAIVGDSPTHENVRLGNDTQEFLINEDEHRDRFKAEEDTEHTAESIPETPKNRHEASKIISESPQSPHDSSRNTTEDPKSTAVTAESAFTPAHLRALAHRTSALFSHGWRAYIHHGFPADEVRPLSCHPYGPDTEDAFNGRNDAMGNVSLTLLDNIDTLILLEQWDELEYVLNHLRAQKDVYFSQNTTVQMFEAAIRWLGGLLLAHMLMSEVLWRAPRMVHLARTYDGFLLHMAHDLGQRLLPAYNTPTKLPLARINLSGTPVPAELNLETCTAGVGTPVVEMTLLLRLTGDVRFEQHATRAFWALWRGRLAAGLVPLSLDPHHGAWLNTDTGVGALIDSFYEHALKGAIIFSDESLWRVFARSYEALVTHLARHVPGAGTYFPNTNTNLGSIAATWIDLLGAFWPGLQVLAGRLTDAVSTHAVYLKVWNTFDLLPERWNFVRGQDLNPVHASVSLEWYPLRPEFIESTYYLYRATRDPFYLEIGSRILQLFETQFKAPCGFAGVQDIRTGERQDRMETFVLGELLKYLYLLFDDANVLHREMNTKNWVMSTEAHPLWYTEAIGRKHRHQFLAQIAEAIVTLDSDVSVSRMKSLWNKLSRGLVRVSSEVGIALQSPYLPFGLGILPTSDRLEVCEVQPKQFRKSNSRFHRSAYSAWPQLFAADAHFLETLVRPHHLGLQYSVELSTLFLETHGLGAPLKCARIPSSTQEDVVLGKLQRPEEYEMYSVQSRSDTHPFLEDDYVMPELSGRMRMECVSAGAVDSTNRRILWANVRNRRPEKWVSAKAEVCRACMINGAQIKQNSTLWTAREYAAKYKGVFEITLKGLFVNNKFVENLRVY